MSLRALQWKYPWNRVERETVKKKFIGAQRIFTSVVTLWDHFVSASTAYNLMKQRTSSMKHVALAHHILAHDWYNFSSATVPDPERHVHSA